MLKKIFFIFLFLFGTLSLGASEYDKDIVVKDQSRNDKVKAVFKEMMRHYEEEDLNGFFSFVSEDRFQQDYMTFYEAIDEDIRVYDILNVDTWVNKITQDGVKRFLYVQWDKRYLSSSNDTEINQRGYSRFLFDEVNGKYKLIQLAGNNFWGKSLSEWTEEVPEIAGQEVYDNSTSAIYDLEVQINSCFMTSSDIQVDFTILDSSGVTYTSNVPYQIVTGGGDTFTGVEPVGTANNNYGTMTPSCTITITVDPNNVVSETDESNNEDSL